MLDNSARPDEVFASLASALALQTGFGLCFLFSDDALGLSWLRNRIQEHLESDRELRQRSAFRLVTSVHLDAAALVQALCEPMPDHRTVVWCDLPRDMLATRALLVGVNEQRQRLIGSSHFYVLALGQAAAHDAPAWAPDLWSVRTLTFRSQNQSRWVRGDSSASQAQTVAEQGGVSNGRPSNSAASRSTIETWKRIYRAWLANPSASAPSPDLALAASHQARLSRQFDDAVTFAQQAHQVATTDVGRANALRYLGDLKRRLGAVQEAQDLYLKAIQLLENGQDDRGRANALLCLGDVKRNLGAFTEAQFLYLRATALYEKERDMLGKANTLHSLGDLKFRTGLIDEAQRLYLEAIGLYETLQDDLGLANTLLSLGNLKGRFGSTEEAYELHLKAINLFEKVHDDMGRAVALRFLADLTSYLGKTHEAQDLYMRAIKLLDKEQYDHGLAAAWAGLAYLLKTAIGKEQDAQDAAKKALHYARRAGSPPALNQIISILMDAGLATATGELIENHVVP